MDQDTLRAIAGIRLQLGMLRSALGAGNPAQAEEIIAKLIHAVEDIGGNQQADEGVIQQLVTSAQNQSAQISTIFTDLGEIKTALQNIIAWGQTVTPPYAG